MRQTKPQRAQRTTEGPASSSERGAKRGSRGRAEAAGEGTNATRPEPDDSREYSMLDSGKHAEKSPYTAGSQ